MTSFIHSLAVLLSSSLAGGINREEYIWKYISERFRDRPTPLPPGSANCELEILYSSWWFGAWNPLGLQKQMGYLIC